MNFNDFHLHGRSFLAPFFGHRFAWAFWSFGSPLAPFGSLLAPFGSLLAPFGSLLAPLGLFCLPFGSLRLPLAPFWLPLAPFWHALAPFSHPWVQFASFSLHFSNLSSFIGSFPSLFTKITKNRLETKWFLNFTYFSQFVSLLPCFFASNFEENPHTTDSTPVESKFPFAPWPSVDPEREFAAGNLDGTQNRPSNASST